MMRDFALKVLGIWMDAGEGEDTQYFQLTIDSNDNRSSYLRSVSSIENLTFSPVTSASDTLG